MVESKSVSTFSQLQKQDGQRGLFVDRGVGSPRLVKSASASAFPNDLKLDTEEKVNSEQKLFYYPYIFSSIIFVRNYFRPLFACD